MALRWMDGFDLYTTSSQLLEVIDQGDSKQAVTYELSNPNNITVSSSGGRFDGGRLVLSQSAAGTAYLDVLLGDNATAVQNAVFVQFAIKFHTFSGSVVDFLRMRDDVGGFPTRLEVGPGNLRLKDADNSTVTTVSDVFVTGSWQYVQCKIKSGDGGDGEVRVLVDGTEVLNDTTSDFLANQPEMDRLRILSAGGRHYSIDDLVILDDEGTENNDFIGDVIIQTLVPDGAGSFNDWAPRAEANVWQQVDDTVPGGHDGAETDCRSRDQEDVSSFTLTDMSEPSTGYINKIHGVQASSVVTNKMMVWNERDTLFNVKNSPSLRYVWPSASQNLRGPFSANNPALVQFDDQNWIQVEGERTNTIVDVDLWTIQGSVTRSADEPDLLGGTGAYKLENIDVGNNDAFYLNSGGTNDAPYAPCIFIKRISTTGVIQLANPYDVLLGRVDIDLSQLGDDWEQITWEHPACTKVSQFINNGSGSGGLHFRAVSGGPLDFYVYWPQTEENLFPSSPISQSGTRSAEEFSFQKEDMPIVFYTGSWTISTYSEHAWTDVSSSTEPQYIYWLNATNYLCVSGSGTETFAKLATTSGSLSRSITYGPSNKVEYSVDFGASSLTVAGAATGDGTTAGTISVWPSTEDVGVGSSATPDGHFFGLISEPVDDTGEETSFRQSIYLYGTKNSGSAQVPTINAPTGFGTTSNVFETRPDTSGSWTQAAINSLQAGFEHV